MAPNPLADFGGGLSTKSLKQHPALPPPQHGPTGQAERAFTAASTFLSGCMAISATQFLGAPLKMIDPKFYEAYMAFTKQSFGVLITTMTQWWSPTVVRVSGDKSIPKQLFHKPDGTLQTRFPKRIIMMANHQLYTDWLYLWWVAYTNNMHGYIYIILKESLKNIPVVGWGAQFYNFIFLSRKWETDKDQFKAHLDKLNNPDDPMWLLIFPEGTNLAQSTREKSAAWAKKSGVQDMKHQLLPRSLGLQFCLQNLRDTTEWLYDCTIGYEGIPPGEFGQDIFTLRSSMFEGRPPKSVNMHFRRFRISDIPIDNDKAFDVWLRNRWREKDYLLEHFVKYDRFPEDHEWLFKQKRTKKRGPQNAKFIETQIQSNSLEEFLSIFAPLSSVMTVLTLFYGPQNPADMLKMIGEAVQQQQAVALLDDGKSEIAKSKDLESTIREATAGMPSLSDIQGASTLSPSAQRNLIQKYIKAVRPMVEQQINLPPNSMRLSNAGKGELSVRSNQKPGPLIQKTGVPKVKATPASKAKSVASDKISMMGTVRSSSSTAPTTPRSAAFSSIASIAPSSSLSTAPSSKQKIVPAAKAPIKPWAMQNKVAQNAAATKSSNNITNTSRPNPTKPVTTPTTTETTTTMKKKKKDPPPTIKMDKANYDKLRARNDSAKKLTPTPPKNVNIDQAALAKTKAKTAQKPILKSSQPPGGTTAQKSGKKSVTIDPAVLAKMKEQK